ncbi:Exosome component 10 [Rhizophlyctis rosea]|nr:Exosome component 10 [Rhizophlyctis rosea]
MEGVTNSESELSRETFSPYADAVFKSLVEVTKASAFLSPGDLAFYRSSSHDFSERLRVVSDDLLELYNQLVLHAAAEATAGDDRVVRYEDVDDVVDRYDHVVDVVDNLLEKADICLDEVTGANKKTAPGTFMKQSAPVALQLAHKGKDVKYVQATNIVRPQLRFEDKIDNSNNPFVRKITYKPNALRPLDYGLPGSSDISPEMEQHVKTLGITDANSSTFSLPHPYEYEIHNIQYPPHVFSQRPEELYAPMEKTPFTWVDTEEKLKELASILDGVSEFAVDLEHHDYRSYQGFTCLMQVSTRKEDFIIDTLVLRSHMHVLNSSFTNPNIVKVFHGAESDIVWLQKDFGLYVVDLFDTYHASHTLEMPHHSLAYLLKFYCNVDANKQYQRSDWRIRPLPAELLNYARSDTHYLLYIYDRMRNEILTISDAETHHLLRATLEKSQQTALKRYEKDMYDAENGMGAMGWRTTMRKYRGGAWTAENFAVFRALHAWRDHIAREEDESPRFVIPDYQLFALTTSMPVESLNVLAICSNPTPALVRMYANEIASLIDHTRVDARESVERRQAEMEKLQAEIAQREREWEDRKRRGPVHVRFDGGGGEQGDDMDEDDDETPGTPAARVADVTVAATSNLFSVSRGADLVFETATERVQVARFSVLFGEGGLEEDEEEERSRAKALQIKSSLYLSPPSVEGLLRRADGAKPPAPQPVATTQPTATPPSSSVPQPILTTTTTPAPPQPNTSELITISSGDSGSDMEVEYVVKIRDTGSKKRKKGKGKGGAGGGGNATPPSDFQPFDYSKAKSVVGGGADAGSGEPPGKRAKEGFTSVRGKEVYSPFAEGGKKGGERKDPRGNARMKSGNRSGNFFK